MNPKAMAQPLLRQPNQVISPWKEGDMALITPSKNFSGKGSIEFWWSPSPGYYFTFKSADEPPKGIAILKTSEVDNIKVEVRRVERNILYSKDGSPSLKANLMNSEGNNIQVEIHPVTLDDHFECEGPLLTQVRQGNIFEEIDHLYFQISNFCIYPLKPITLEYRKWNVSLDPQDNISELLGNLNNNGSYALTYLGCITCKDGSLFTSYDVESLIEPLQVFLSFLRGAWYQPLIFEGWAKGKPIVSTHPNPLLPPIVPMTSWPRQPEGLMWCYNHIQHDLNEAFNSLMALYEEKQIKTSQDQVDAYSQLKAVINNWIESGLTNFGETAIVLIQAALESLVDLQSNKCLSGMNLESLNECFNKLSADTRIRWLLNELNIPADIPPESQDLAAYLKIKKQTPSDGPKAITYMRNGIIHATPKNLTRPLGTPTDLIPSEVAMKSTIILGRMYVVLSILVMLNYKGNFTNYLTGLTQQIPLKKIAISQKPVS
jgi:hypothetical protein